MGYATTHPLERCIPYLLYEVYDPDVMTIPSRCYDSDEKAHYRGLWIQNPSHLQIQ